MDSHQSVVLPFQNLAIVTDPDRQTSDYVVWSSGKTEDNRKEAVEGNYEGFIGVLEVYIHQARDIHNICIYHKQDVYAKLCLTSNSETTVSTQIINGGGNNPVFNENLRLNVGTIDSSLKCEIWMLSRVRNYLEDQLLGFALVPLSEVLIGNGKLEQEFCLSSTDLFHSPAGFVQLSLSYSGSSPEVLAIPTPRPSLVANTAEQDSEILNSLPKEFEKIEFPDPKIVNENDLMVSEYFGISCATSDSQSFESLDTSDTENHDSSDTGIHVVESVAVASLSSIEVPKINTPPSSVSTNESPSASIPGSAHSFCETPGASKSSNQDHVSALKEKGADVPEAESESSGGIASESFAQSYFKLNIEPVQTVVQQDIVDMYMKSMQQFTESLAKMKLPMDIETESTNLENANLSSDRKLQASKSTGSRVFYGSSAFF